MSRAFISYGIQRKGGLLSNCFKILEKLNKQHLFGILRGEVKHVCNLGTPNYSIPGR